MAVWIYYPSMPRDKQITQDRQGSRRGLLSRLLELDLQWTFLGLLLLGFALLAVSWKIDLASVLFDPKSEGYRYIPARQVGYAFAVNWGLTYVAFFPLIGVMLLSVLQDIPELMSDLQSFQVLQASPRVRAADQIVGDWKTGSRVRAVFIVGLGIVFSAVFSLQEWINNNLLRLLEYRRAEDLWDWDWGLKCAMAQYRDECSQLQVFINYSFDLACFLAQFLYIALLLTFVIYMLDFRRAFLRRRPGVTLMPNLKLNDPRRGFGQFEPVLTKMLIVVLVAFLVAYCVRLENLYLRSHASSLWSYIEGEVVQGALAGIAQGFGNGIASGFKAAGNHLFDAGGEPGRQTVMAAVGLFLLFSVVTSVVVGTVLGAARRARTNALAYYTRPGAQALYGLSLAEEQSRAESMMLWPLGYMRMNRLFLWTLLAVLSLIFFRIGLIAFGASIGLLLRTGAKLIEKSIEAAARSDKGGV